MSGLYTINWHVENTNVWLSNCRPCHDEDTTKYGWDIKLKDNFFDNKHKKAGFKKSLDHLDISVKGARTCRPYGIIYVWGDKDSQHQFWIPKLDIDNILRATWVIANRFKEET